MKYLNGLKKMKKINAIRILFIGTGYEALVHLGDGSMRLVHSDTIEGIFKELDLDNICDKKR